MTAPNRLIPAAFMSYVHSDDEHDHGRITELCRYLSAEVRMQTGEEFFIFQDRKDIRWGQNWMGRIEQSLDDVTFLIPILTPSFFRSKFCRNELERFLEREKKLNRDDLVLPVYYVDTSQINDPTKALGDELVKTIASRQYADWRKLRFESFNSIAVRIAIEQLAIQIREALERPSSSGQLHESYEMQQATSTAKFEHEEVGLLEATQAAQDMMKLVSQVVIDLNYTIARVNNKLSQFDNLTKRPTPENTNKAGEIASEVALGLENNSEIIEQNLPRFKRNIDIFMAFLSDYLQLAEPDDEDENSIDYNEMIGGLLKSLKSALAKLRSHKKSILEMAQRSGKIKPAARRMAQAVDGLIVPLDTFASFCEKFLQKFNQGSDRG
jgi:hypothetical protein